MTRFKELCMDTTGSGAALGQFWAAATGCTYVASSSATDTGDVIGPEEGMGIAICLVPEPKTVKNRVHLDLHTGSVDSLLALGARRAPGYGGDPWTVLLDPEGGELCAFVREGELPTYLGYELVLDTLHGEAQARWWAAVFGVEPQHDDQDYWWIAEVPGMPFESLVFDPVPVAKTVKNRVHWDLYGDAGELAAAGARVLAELPGWTVMGDPEGNVVLRLPRGQLMVPGRSLRLGSRTRVGANLSPTASA